MRDFWHLSDVDWLAELSDEERDALQQQSTQRHYAVGEIVFTPAATPHSLYLLESGLVRIYRLSETGLETTLGYVKPGEVFGELTAFGDYPRESFAQAVEASLVWKIPQKVFQPIVRSRPRLTFAISKQMGERLKRIESRVENLVFRDVHTRVILILLELADHFGVPAADGSVSLAVHVTQAEIATLVGSTRQSVNASLGELADAGLIRRANRRLVLLKPDELRRIARPRN
jgi:CRP-like cAMP-binding protein